MEISSTITDISNITILQNLGPLLLENLASPIYKLTAEQQTSIQVFIQTFPTVFDKITKNIEAITKDGKIDLHDIPYIIQLLADSYQLKGLLPGDTSVIFIQYTINVIIDSKYVIMPEFEKQIIETLIHSCITLLRMNVIGTSDKKGFFCWK
jgi:hypothetical protein